VARGGANEAADRPAVIDRGSSVVRRTSAEVALAVGATIVALVALEITLRVLDVRTASYHAIGAFTVYDRELGWRLAPSRDVVFRGAHFAVRVVQNAEGLRARHYGFARQPGRRRIVVLGDSVVWCWGVEQADCFTEQLEAALPDTDVINAGVPAYSTAQEMLFYERDVRRYRPDLVLLVFVPNDVFENAAGGGPRFRLEHGALVAPVTPARRRKGRVVEWLQAHSRLFAEANLAATVGWQAVRTTAGRWWPLPSRAEAAPGGGFVFPSAPPDGKARALTEALLDRLRADVARDGARFAVALETAPRDMVEWQRAFWAARGVPFLDLGPALYAAERSGVRVRLDGDPHLSAAGQNVIASALRTFLDERADEGQATR
jgi:lysophospholipase L1-like esterase